MLRKMFCFGMLQEKNLASILKIKKKKLSSTLNIKMLVKKLDLQFFVKKNLASNGVWKPPQL